MSLYARSANDEEFWKMIHDPQQNPDTVQKLVNLSPEYGHSSLKMSLKSIHNARDILHRHTDTQTTTQT